MKTLIIYSTLGGGAEKCARILNEKIEGSVLCNIKKETPDVSSADAVIIGGGIYAGRASGKLRKFVKKNVHFLKMKPHAFFVCCLDPDYMKYIKSNFPGDLTVNAFALEGFGGQLEQEQYKGFLAAMVKAMRDGNVKATGKAPEVITSRIDALAAKATTLLK